MVIKDKKRIPELRFTGFDGEWEEKRLENIAEVLVGQSPPSESYNNLGLGKYLIQGNADISNRKTNPRTFTSQPTKLCNVGDIIMNVRAPVGTIPKSLHNACIGRGVCSIQINQKKNIRMQL